MPVNKPSSFPQPRKFGRPAFGETARSHSLTGTLASVGGCDLARLVIPLGIKSPSEDMRELYEGKLVARP